MPHDANGKSLKEGDVVSLRFLVKQVQPSETACNVTLQAIPSDAAKNEVAPQVACNSKLVTLVQ